MISNWFILFLRIPGSRRPVYMARQVRLQNRLHDIWGRQEGIKDDNVDLTTGVTTRFPSGVDGDHAGYAGIRPATQVGRRGVGGGSRGV